MTRAYLGLVLLNLAYLTAGYAFLRGIGLARGGRAAALQGGLALFTGWALMGTALATAAALGFDPDALSLVVALGLVIGGSLALGRRFRAVNPATAPSDRRPLFRTVELVGLALVGLALAAALAVAARSGADADWDVWTFWLAKAKAIYWFGGLGGGPGGFTSYANPDYPPLVPALDAATFHLMGGPHPALLPLQQCVLGIAFVAAIAVLLLRHVPRWVLFPCLAMLVLSPAFWSRLDTVLPDQSVAYLLAAAAIGCILWIEERRPAWLALATVYLAAATLTKNEGLLLGALLAAAMIVASVVVHRRPGLVAGVLVLGLAAIVPWKLWLVRHDQPTSAGDYSWSALLHPVSLADRLHRLSYASRHMAGLAFGTDRWVLVLPLALVVLAACVRARPAVAIAFAAWLVVGFGGLATVYWIGRPELHYYVETSASRVVATLPLVAGAVFPLVLGLAMSREDEARVD